MTTGKSDRNDLPPGDSSQAKNSPAQEDLGPEDSQVLKEFPWLKSLKTDKPTSEVANPAPKAEEESESKSDAQNQVADESEQGRSKKKKRGAGKKKGKSETEAGSEPAGAPEQKSKQRKSNKKGKPGSQPQVEPNNAEPDHSSAANVEIVEASQTHSPVDQEQANVDRELASEESEQPMTAAAEPEQVEVAAEVQQPTDAAKNDDSAENEQTTVAVDEQPPADQKSAVTASEPEVKKTQEHFAPEKDRVVKTTLIETYISNLMEDEPSDSTNKGVAPEAVSEGLGNRVVKTLLETDISKLTDNPEIPSPYVRKVTEPDSDGTPGGEQKRKVAKTMLETDISKFKDIQATDSKVYEVAPEAVPIITPVPTSRVAKTMLEMDITKFAENAQTAASGAVPEHTKPETPGETNPPQQQPRPVAKTLLETDISKFTDAQSEDEKNAPEVVPESAPPQRAVAKTLLETDISKFTDVQPSDSTDEKPAPVAVPESAHTQRTVAKTLLETDISKFIDSAQNADPQIAADTQPTSETAPEPQETRTVARTLLETDISKFTDAGNVTASQTPENKGTSENRVVPKTLLETDISKFTDSQEPEPPQHGNADAGQQTRSVAKTLLETDISKFVDQSGSDSDNFENQPEPMESRAPQTLSRADSPSFADVDVPERISLVSGQDSSVTHYPEETVPAQQYLYYEQERQEQQHDGSQTEERYVPKTLLDMELIQSTLGNTIVRMEAAAAEELRASQAMRKLEPIVDFKLASANCPWRWEESNTKERVAFCEQCGTQVYNFQGLQQPEALKIVFQRENTEKPNLFKRADGKFMTRDCPIARKKAAMPSLIAGVALLVIALVVLLFFLIPKSNPIVVEQADSQTQLEVTSPTHTDANTQSNTNSSTQSSSSQSPSGVNSSTPSAQSGTTIQQEPSHTRVFTH